MFSTLEFLQILRYQVLIAFVELRNEIDTREDYMKDFKNSFGNFLDKDEPAVCAKYFDASYIFTRVVTACIVCGI